MILHDAYLLLGSNMGDRLQNLNEAVTRLAGHNIRVVSGSPVYETEAWGEACKGQDAYLNAAIHIETSMGAQQLLETILSTEARIGRVRKEKWEPRIIDIDILIYSDEIIQTPELTVPHPFLAERRFALLPLSHLFSKKVPGTNTTVDEMLDFCPDSAQVTLLESPLDINRKSS